MTFGPEWIRGEDGRLWRSAARVILLDPDDRVLLARGHDADDPGRSWWFTIGGGIDTGETSSDAAIREVAEETGIRLGASDLVGPVLTRSAIFDFAAEHVRQDEEFFLARVPGGAVSRDGWTEVERDLLDELRWWSVSDLAEVDIEIFPTDLPGILAELVSGWDGQVRHLGLQDDDEAARS